MKKRIQRVLFFCVLMSITGCEEQAYYTDAQGSQALTFPNTNRIEAMQAAEHILGQMHFTISELDTATGTLTTNPLPGAQFFEFWRKDAASSTSLVESSLHTIRRSVTLEFSEQDTSTVARCLVLTERLNVPNRDVTGHSRANSVLTETSSSIPTMRLDQAQKDGMDWVSLGYDPDLAQSILYHIETELTDITSSK
ncbi:MAG: hypothetical protein K9N55_12870 [Phycisphaerae bacterium]|nr:hypothetical protein [Phycisphaerae bacterium]